MTLKEAFEEVSKSQSQASDGPSTRSGGRCVPAGPAGSRPRHAPPRAPSPPLKGTGDQCLLTRHVLKTFKNQMNKYEKDLNAPVFLTRTCSPFISMSLNSVFAAPAGVAVQRRLALGPGGVRAELQQPPQQGDGHRDAFAGQRQRRAPRRVQGVHRSLGVHQQLHRLRREPSTSPWNQLTSH